jgi:hypothetical protein
MPFGRAAKMTDESDVKELPEYIYISKTIENFGKRQVELLESINGKLTFIVIVIIVGIAIQVLSSCIHL